MTAAVPDRGLGAQTAEPVGAEPRPPVGDTAWPLVDGVSRPTAAPRVVEVARTALDWVYDHRACFALPEDVLAPDVLVDRTWKPLGELAQLGDGIRRHTTSGPARRRAAELLEFAWEQTRGGSLFLDQLRAEPMSTYPLEIYAAFRSAGFRHPAFEELARALARTRSWAHTEQDPTRRLGILNAEHRTGLPLHAAPLTALQRTWLGSLPEPWMFERSSGYALTHVVFHLTDWGNAPHRMPRRLARYLHHWLPAWLDSCLEEELWDLAGELLAVAASLPTPVPARIVEPAWTRLAAAQDAAGGLCEVGPSRRDGAAGPGFFDCYHSTLVAAYAATLTAARLYEVPPVSLTATVLPGPETAPPGDVP
ncbi:MULTISPECIES: DUF6895 family protein [unclassified Streptomyces]|uniref:DUF6895 family protein n=1 Tax=unclassified Streptomyces TaxID=2593676 RepID=UPI0007C7422B|nr:MULTISPECIES: hypothetical protein [unclassified Streptomyces]